MRTDIRSKQHPPVVHIGCALHSICFNLVDSQKRFLTDFVLPILYKIRPTERARQQLSPGPMFTRVKHGEDTCLGEVGQAQVPLTLQVFCTDLMDLFKSIEVCNADFVRRKSDNRTVLLMEIVDVEDPLACDDGSLQSEMCEASVPRSRQMPRGTCESHVEELVELAQCFLDTRHFWTYFQCKKRET